MVLSILSECGNCHTKEVLVATFKPVSLRRAALALGIFAAAVLSDPSVTSTKLALLAPADVRNSLAIYGADAVSIDRNARDFKRPDQFEWKSRPGSASQTVALFGDPSKPGLYAQLLKRGPDDWSQPHSHPNERIITVVAGTFLIGTGPKFDRNNTVALGPGSVVRDIPNQMHYDGTGPEGATIEIIAMGPAARN
jgi:hypothetical protein